MPIYPDKKAGKPTGRWRVEVQKNGRRYRERHDDYKAAKADEERVLRLFADSSCDAPGDLKGVSVRKDQGPKDTLAHAIREATGRLWRGSSSETTNWIRVNRMAAVVGLETRLDHIDTRTIDGIVDVIRSGSDGKAKASDATVNRYLSHFHKLLVWSKARGLRTVALEDVSFDWQEESSGRIRWITPEEEARLRQLLPTRIWKLVKVAIETGCRRGELLSIESGQINGGRLHLWDTKTDDPRTVPIDPETVRLLRDLLVEGMPTASELRYQWDKARKAMGLQDDEDFVFHSCRHTCATRLVEAGVQMLVIQRWLGHRSIQTTMRYAHVHDVMLEDALVQRSQHRTQIHLRTRRGLPASGSVGNQESLQAA